MLLLASSPLPHAAPFVRAALPPTADAKTEHDNAQSMYFAIPSLPLQQALDIFGMHTGWSGLYLASVTGDRTSGGISGWYAPREALQALLEGTGLRAHFTASDAFILEASDDAAAPEAAAASSSYDTVLQRGIRDAFCSDSFLSRRDYRVALRLYVDAQGQLNRVALLDTTGDPRRDRAIVSALQATRLAEAPADVSRPFFVLLLPQSAVLQGCQSE